MLGRLVTSVGQVFSHASGGSLFTSICNSPYAIANQWNLTSVRTIIRYHFPHPHERRRIKRHGWAKRMATLSGRKILMRRILKGKHVLSH